MSTLLLLLASPDIPIVCAAVGPDVMCSYRCCFVPGVPDIAGVSAIAALTIAVESGYWCSTVPGVPAVVYDLFKRIKAPSIKTHNFYIYNGSQPITMAEGGAY